MELIDRSNFDKSQRPMDEDSVEAPMQITQFREVKDQRKRDVLLTDAKVEGKKEPTYKSRCFLTGLVLNIALSSFFMGYCMVYFSQLKIGTMLDILKFPDIDHGLAGGLLNGAIFVGALFGAFFSSILIKYFSRRHGILIINAFALVVGGLIFIENFYSLLIFRLLQGVAVGLGSTLSPVIIKQLSPTEISGSLGSYTSMGISFGQFFGSFFAYVLSQITNDTTGRSTWYYVYAFPLLTIILQSLLLIFVYPYETPKYLLMNGKDEEARALIDIIYKEQYAQEIFEKKRNEAKVLLARMSFNEQTNEVRKSKTNLLPIFVAMNLAILKQFSGTNAVTVYAGNVAESIVSGQLLLLVPTIVNFAAFVGGFSSGFILTYLGRKTGGQIGTVIEVIANILAGIAVYIASEARTTEITLLIVGLFVNRMTYGALIGPITWQYMPEIVEPKMSPFTTALNWFTGSLVVLLFPILASLGNPGPIFIFFAVYCFLSFIFNQFYMVETKGKTQLQIKQKFKELSCC